MFFVLLLLRLCVKLGLVWRTLESAEIEGTCVADWFACGLPVSLRAVHFFYWFHFIQLVSFSVLHLFAFCSTLSFLSFVPLSVDLLSFVLLLSMSRCRPIDLLFFFYILFFYTCACDEIYCSVSHVYYFQFKTIFAIFIVHLD